jgi:hypothetical protein
VQLFAPDTSNGNPLAGNVTAAESSNESLTSKNDITNIQRDDSKADKKAKAKAEDSEKAGSRGQGAGSISSSIANEKDDNTINDQPTSPPASIQALQENTLNDDASPKVVEQMTAGAAANKSMSKRDEGYYANQMSPELMSKRVTGHISDHHGEALISVFVDIPNTNLFTTSDDHGNFELYLPKPTSELEVTYSGYADTTFTVSQGQENILITLHEVNDIGQFKVIDGIPFQKSASVNTAFLEYLKSHSHYPIENNFTPTSKEVTIEFRVSPDGHPISIKSIKSSADKKYSAEAIRLINEGPSWVCEDGVYPCTKKYTIYFK